MTPIAKREFDVLDVTGQRYPQWKDDIIAHLGAMGLEHTIGEVRDPYDLLNHLEARFGHHHDVLLPRLREDWKNLRFQDFTSVNEYNSALFRISSQLEYCGPNLQYARQLRQDKFTKFTDLIAVLLLSEQHDKILFKNDNMRPSGPAAIPKANAIAKFGHGR
ncbi:hypothetical protein RND81_04G083500 [Saponaria officinalis]|uniref:Uncharacterized protein n=1 Tax=Saponaria officinalis TaxID=3572 RepID=A0AAW1LIN2_SAPOF